MSFAAVKLISAASVLNGTNQSHYPESGPAAVRVQAAVRSHPLSQSMQADKINNYRSCFPS
jgi:hypothetical protein